MFMHSTPTGENRIWNVTKRSGTKVMNYLNKLHEIMAQYRRPHAGTVAINMKPVTGAWGGSSVFVWQFMAALKRCGFRIRFDLKDKIDVIVIIDPRHDLQSKAFGMDEILSYKRQHPNVKIIHRINECDKRKNTTFMDPLLLEANKIADFTVFISTWLRDYFVDKWFDPNRPNSVIYNGADPAHFHPVGSKPYDPNGTMRVVTHHWSDNPMKGFPVYQSLDTMIASGELKKFELWVIGRWPKEIKWRTAKAIGPKSGKALGDLLRQCHLYITASLWEPCGMHHVEGAQCGLPLLSHVDGGGIVEAAETYGLLFDDDLKDKLESVRCDYPYYRDKVIAYMPSGDRMASDYIRVVYQLLADRTTSTKIEAIT